uniref:Uncharacterized protein n=1 Tax=Oryza brachyantha TaxID=4533 RepID=J3L0U7_ORYBR
MATRCVSAPATACHISRSGHPGSRTASGDRSATPEPGSGGDKDPCGEQRGGSRNPRETGRPLDGSGNAAAWRRQEVAQWGSKRAWRVVADSAKVRVRHNTGATHEVEGGRGTRLQRGRGRRAAVRHNGAIAWGKAAASVQRRGHDTSKNVAQRSDNGSGGGRPMAGWRDTAT